MEEIIQLYDFIFHVVHNGYERPILMEQTPIHGFEHFFIERIKEVKKGNRFNFLEESSLLQQMNNMSTGETTFLDVSKRLAIDFHAHQDRRIKPGVLILIKATFDGEIKYILMKYDHDEVIHYELNNGIAVLESITNTFSKNKDSLQKSAIIDIEATIPNAIVVDKSDQINITNFFRGFLGISRMYDHVKLTDKLKDAYISTVRQFRNELPNEYTSQSSMNFYSVVQNNEAFVSDNFLPLIFGPHYNTNMDAFFNRQLRLKGIDGESFLFNKSMSRPKQKKLKTDEGVIIQYPDTANDTVRIQHEENGRAIITIRTSKLHEEG
jgi:hypothetical protein